MNRPISIFSCLLISILFFSCKKETAGPKLNYNQKANEVIQQVILNDSCGCILEIPNESAIEISLAENPMFDTQKKAIKELHLKSKTELDSLEKLTRNFILDFSFLKQKNIKVIKRESLKEIIKDTTFFKTCPKGILSITKPVFDNNYKTAIIYYGHAFTCIGTPPMIYRFEKGKWITK